MHYYKYGRCRIKQTVKMKLQGFIRNEFIDQHPLAIGNAISNERNKMAMMDAANDLNLSLELPLPLPATRLEALNRDFFSTRQHTFVHVPKSTLTQDISRGKPISGRG